MKILIAIDKFKGSLTSLQAAQAIREGLSKAIGNKELQFDVVEIADGGDGSAAVLQSVNRGAKVVEAVAAGPLGGEIGSSFLLYGDGCAFIEMAKVSGLELVPKQKRNPLHTTTYGLGELIRKAYGCGAKKITLSIGGSATNDGGTGMLQALGFRFYDKQGGEIADYMCGKFLEEIGRVEWPADDFAQELASGKITIEAICDVINPLLGENGATMVYGPQKGAGEEELQRLEKGMRNLVRSVGDTELHMEPGAGAAGGVGYAVRRFLGGKMVSGWRFFAGITSLEKRMKEADLVISGEGRIDSQSLSGKVVDGVLTLAKKYDKRVWLFCGVNLLQSDCGVEVFALSEIEPDIAKCISDAAPLLEELAYRAAL